MNEITNTEADKIIPELWRPKMLEARYAAKAMTTRCLSVDGEVKAKGDILHVSVEPTVSVNSVSSVGGLTNQALTPTESQLTVDQWKECTIDVVDKAQRQSIVDMLTAYVPAFGKAMRADIEGALTALYSDVTTNTVGATAAPTQPADPDLLTAAVQKLLDLDVPVDDANDISFCFHTSQWPVLRKIKEFNDASFTGSSKGGSLEIKIPDLYGIPTYFTTKIVSTGTPAVRKNFLFHRQAFAWGMQKNFNLETLARTRKSTPISADWLYGVKTVRQNHACLINTAA